jgi:hypothetical protein
MIAVEISSFNYGKFAIIKLKLVEFDQFKSIVNCTNLNIAISQDTSSEYSYKYRHVSLLIFWLEIVFTVHEDIQTSVQHLQNGTCFILTENSLLIIANSIQLSVGRNFKLPP